MLAESHRRMVDAVDPPWPAGPTTEIAGLAAQLERLREDFATVVDPRPARSPPHDRYHRHDRSPRRTARAGAGDDPPPGARGACPGLLLGDVRRDPLEHGRLDGAAEDHRRPRRQPVRLHLGRHLDAAGAHRHARRSGASSPTSSTASCSCRPASSSTSTGSILAGLVAVDDLADRLPRHPGHRRRRPDRARPGDPLRPRLPARARPLLRLPRRRVRRRHRRRPADRRRHHRRPRLALVLLRRRAVRGRRVRRPAAHAAPAAPPPRGPHRLPRRRR